MAEHEQDAMAEQTEPVAQHADSAVRPSHPTWPQWSRVGARHPFDSDWVPAWLRPTGPENRLPVAASILVAIALQVWLSGRYGLHPRWLLPLLEIALLVVLTAINPVRLSRRTRVGRYLSMGLAGLITLDNVVSALVLDYGILTGKTSNDALGLLSTGAAIYVTNVIVFGIWYWELDRGGPFNRAAGTVPHPDFLFPQMVSPELSPEHWEPYFLDYLYTSFIVDALSPTNTLPGNPAALRRAFDSGGKSVIRGAKNMLDDILHNGGWPSQVDSTGFEVGVNMAATPGAVVYRSDLIELIQYEPADKQVHAVPLLFCPPWINPKLRV